MAVTETYAGNIQMIPESHNYSFKASGTLNEGRVVELNTAVTDVICIKQASASSKVVLGYVGADWEANDYAVMYTGGIARLEDSGSGITIADRVVADTSGTIKTLVSGSEAAIVGVALETITASEFGKIFVNICYND